MDWGATHRKRRGTIHWVLRGFRWATEIPAFRFSVAGALRASARGGATTRKWLRHSTTPTHWKQRRPHVYLCKSPPPISAIRVNRSPAGAGVDGEGGGHKKPAVGEKPGRVDRLFMSDFRSVRGEPAPGSDYGRMTESITWMTPLEPTRSVAMTLAPSMKTEPSFTVMVADLPLTVGTAPGFTSAASTLAGTTW
jgi:hypothetical protein